MIGPPRRPARIRVADESLAAELREVVGADTEVTVAPTPELDAVLRHMACSLPEGDEAESYLEAGRVSAATVGKLFRAAEVLYRLAPWKVANDGQVLRLDIPGLEVEGACVSIIGALGESFGFVIFPSLAGFHAFANGPTGLDADDAPIDLGTTFLSLAFEPGTGLPMSLRREVSTHGWPVADPRAYPRVEHRDRDGMRRPLTERDVRIVAACASALAAFFVRHRDIFEHTSFTPVCESLSDQDDLTVRFTAPYDAGSLFEIEGFPPARTAGVPKVGRNDPCPCGSGKKYKKCHFAAADTGRPTSAAARAAVHETDERLVGEMRRYARRRFGEEWHGGAEDFSDAEATVQLFWPWSVYHVPVQGHPVVDWFVKDRGGYLSSDDRAWLAAQRQAWMTIWEVTAVEPGASATVRDLLTGETRCVREVSGSKTLVNRDVVLGRVVDHRGLSVFCGVHPRPLPPPDAAEVVRRICSRLRRKPPIPAERLRDYAMGRYQLSCWEDAVEALDLRRLVPPALFNTDGDDLLLTVDHFIFDPRVRPELEARLAVIEGVSPPEEGEERPAYTFHRAGNAMHREWERTIIGSASIADGRMRLETNSVRRADDLCRRIEAACGGLLRHRRREHTDPLSLLARRGAPAERSPAPQAPEVQRLVRDYKERHYADWIDQPLPALGGKTPRQALRTPRGRERVDVLLKDMENLETRLPAGERFDFNRIRQVLGLHA
jgi:hypothetical protein